NNSYATGNVSGNDYVGGLVGENDEGTVSNTYSTGYVNGSDDKVGGLVGENFQGTINKSFAAGEVNGHGLNIGGLVGDNWEGSINNSFWDMNTTGRSSSAGGTGKTTAEMKDVATFTDTSTEGLDEPWDFIGDPNDDGSDEDIWDMDKDGEINDGYPYLNWSEEDETDTEPPTADAGDDKTVEVEEEFTLDASASSDNVGIASYEWDLDSGETKTGEQITHTYDEAGNYTFELTVTDEAGNTDTDTLEITVEESEGGDDDGGDDGGENGDGGTSGFTSILLLTATIIALVICQKNSEL
ncbi:MAG: PKD domain-containing protein, partial [Thermoplasmata archaeon]